MHEFVSQEQFNTLQGQLADTLFKVVDLTRSPSKAALIGTGPRSAPADTSGAFIRALTDARNSDATTQAAGKAGLDALGVTWADPPDSKATLGTTTAGGGAVLPLNVVERIVPILAASNIYRELLTIVPNIAAAGVDIPTEDAVPVRAAIAPWGTLKVNADVAMNKYTATLYTLAEIMDVANQLLRHSAGAAEADVIDRLGRAFGLGEAYYLLNGSGTAEPYGLLTALAAVGGFDSTKSAPTTTIATSIAGTVVAAIEALALRAIKPDACVLDVVSFYKAMTEATTSFSVLGSMAGQALSPMSLGTDGAPRLFTVPLYCDPNMPSGTGIVGQFKAAKLYLGQGFRIDVSSEAGNRFDYNLTGYRAEEELAFNAVPYVHAGRFQRLLSLGT